MRGLTIAGALVVVMLAQTAASASPILDLSGPTQYIPGQTSILTFDVTLSDAVDLASYYIDVLLTTSSGAVTTDTTFGVLISIPSRYVFGPDTSDARHFLGGVDSDGATYDLLYLSDFHDANNDTTLEPVTTVAGANDNICSFALQITPAQTGDLRIMIDVNTLELTDNGLAPIAGIDELKAAMQPLTITAVPEPTTLLLLTAPAAVICRRRPSA